MQTAQEVLKQIFADNKHGRRVIVFRDGVPQLAQVVSIQISLRKARYQIILEGSHSDFNPATDKWIPLNSLDLLHYLDAFATCD